MALVSSSSYFADTARSAKRPWGQQDLSVTYARSSQPQPPTSPKPWGRGLRLACWLLEGLEGLWVWDLRAVVEYREGVQGPSWVSGLTLPFNHHLNPTTFFPQLPVQRNDCNDGTPTSITYMPLPTKT